MELDGLGGGLAFGVSDGEGVLGGFLWRNVEATGVRGPNFANGRVQSHRFCIGDVVAKLGAFAGVDGGRRKIESADGEFGATEFLNGGEIVGAAFFGGPGSIAFFEGAIVFPASEENKGKVQSHAESNDAGNEDRPFENEISHSNNDNAKRQRREIGVKE